MTDGFGAVNWWGFSPCLDLQSIKGIDLALEDISLDENQSRALNVLIVGAGDCRHILKTLAHSYRHVKSPINFYVLENNLELYARHMLLLGIALEKPERMGLQEKTELFLEIFGNTLVRQQSMDYVEKMSNLFIRMVTDFDFLEQRMPLLDLSLLKFKERDFLEGIFKFWRNPDRSLLDINKCWELRLRKYLGERYDAIPNVFDWDFTMKLAERGAEVINGKQYSQWRTTGSAFTIREGTYDVHNKTLASGFVFRHEGERLARRGYWGDILVSPYISFGIESEEKSFFKKSNNMFMKCSEDISEYNVLSMLYSLAHHEKYVPPKTDAPESQKKGPTLTEITEEEEVADTGDTSVTDAEKTNPLDIEFETLPTKGAKIFFLPLECLPDLHKKSRFQKLFNMVYLSNRFDLTVKPVVKITYIKRANIMQNLVDAWSSKAHHLNTNLTQTFADKASLVMETAKFMLELNTQQYGEFVQKLAVLAVDAGCKCASDVDEKNDHHVMYTFTHTAAS